MQKEEPDSVEARLRAAFRRGLDGDAASYRAFLSELSTRLRAYFRRRLYKMPDEAEDLVQDTLIAVHNQRHTYDPAQPLTPWVYAIARYKLVDTLRRHRRTGLAGEMPDEAYESLSSADEDAAEAKRDLGKLLALLPERQRLPIVHVKLEGLSVAESARITGMSESAVKVAVHRGLKALAARLRGGK